MTDISDDIVNGDNAVEKVDSNINLSHSLLRGQLKFVRTIALSVGIQGPVAGVIVGPAVLAGLVGGAGALAYLLGFIAMAFVAFAFIIFSKEFNSSGSIYTFNGSSLGPTYGFVSAWILLLVYISFAAGVYASTADITQNFLSSFGVNIWWVWIALAGFFLTMIFAYKSIKLSSILIFTLEALAVGLITIVGIIVLIKGGYRHNAWSFKPFEPNGISISILGLGVVNAFSAFSGFEGATTLGEESVRSTRTIPKAVFWSLLGSSFIYIVFTWIANNAYSSTSALAHASAPFVTIAANNVGSWMGNLINFAGVISSFGAQLACINAANRIIFALGREVSPEGTGILSQLTRTHRRYRSPIGALVVSGGLSLAGLLMFSMESSPIRALTIIVELGAYLIIVAYLMTVVAALVWVWKHGRNPVKLTILFVGIGILAYVLYDTFFPFPSAPFNLVVFSAIACVGAGIVVALLPKVRSKLMASKLILSVQNLTGRLD